MMVRQWWINLWYRPHDRSGNAKWLLGRASDPSAMAVTGISAEARDETLHIICESFDIPLRQKYCLRPEDELLAIYRAMNGPRDFDQFQFERLTFELEEHLHRDVSSGEIGEKATVADIARLIGNNRNRERK